MRHFLFLASTLILFCDTDGLHINGVWDTSDFFHYVTRFGFQRALKDKEQETQGYVYGNISAVSEHSRYTLAIVHEELFPVFYEGKDNYPQENVCQRMFERLDCDAAVNSTEGFLGTIPILAPNARNLLADSQFTYPIREIKEPRFWFLSMVACHRVSSCRWEISRQERPTKIRYSVWLVNGSPDAKHLNPFEHQFSFDEQDVIEIYLSFLLAYVILLPIQTWAHGRQGGHLLPRLLSIALCFELGGIFLNLVHYLKFASDGVPVDPVRISGNLLDSFGQSCLMLVLILLARGHGVSARPADRRSSIYVFSSWAFSSCLYAVFFAWNLVEEDEINDIDQWSTWPGYLALALRMLIAIWFIYDLTRTFSVETCEKKQHLYLHVGAGFLVWFVYLPTVALVCSHISALNRFKTILCISYAADFVAFAILVHLFWPSRSSILHDFHVDSSTATDHQNRSVSTFSFFFSGDDPNDDDDDVEIAETECKDDDKTRLLLPVNGRVERLIDSDAESSPATSDASSSGPSLRNNNNNNNKRASRGRPRRRARAISNSVFGAEEVDHHLIAELLQEDNQTA